MRKVLLMSMVIALLMSLFAGCATGAPDEVAGEESAESQGSVSEDTTDSSTTSDDTGEKIKLKVMILSEDSNRQKIYQDYYSANIEEAFPNYEVEFELPGSEENYTSKITVYNASETLPDVFWGRDVVYQAGNALPLTYLLDDEEFMSNYTNKSALIPAPDGEIYCLNSGTDSFFAGPIFYNKDIFDKEGLTMPTNYDELLALVKTLKEKGYVPIAATAWAINNFLFADLVGADDYNTMLKLERKEIGFEDQAVLDGVAKLKELTDAGAFPVDVTSIEHQVHEQMFIDGKAAMIYHPIWVYPAISAADFEIGFDYLPEIFGQPLVNSWGSATGGGFMVAKNSQHKEAAVEVAAWLVMQDAKFFNTEAGNPTAIKGFDTLPEGAPDVNAYFYDKIRDEATVVAPSFCPNYMTQAQKSEFSTNVAKLLTDQVTVEEFCTIMAGVYQ